MSPKSAQNTGNQSSSNNLDPEVKYENLAEEAFVGVYIVQDGKFVYANPRMADIFGYTLDEFVNKLGPVDVIHPEDFPHIHEKSKKRLIGEIEREYYQFRGIKKGGEVIYVEVYGSRTQFSGKPAVTGVINDISERVKAEEALRLELQRKKDFINVASHELRTPLQTILGFLDLMLAFPDKYGLNEEAKRHQGLMIESAKREEKIVNRMLEYSILNVEGEDIRPEHRRFSPYNVVEVILNSKHLKSEAEFELDISRDLTIESDVDFFYNIMGEFCSNAVQYSNPPRKIRISSHQDGDNVVFSVTDNGIGMNKEVLQAIFTPFFIGDGTRLSRKYGRLGLGLPIAKRMAVLLGGNITAESEGGKGSTFTLVLPKGSGGQTNS